MPPLATHAAAASLSLLSSSLFSSSSLSFFLSFPAIFLFFSPYFCAKQRERERERERETEKCVDRERKLLTTRSRFALAGHSLHSLSLSLSFLPARKTTTTSSIFLFRSLGFLGKPLRRQQRLPPSSVLIKTRAASSTSSISTTTQAGRKRRDMPAAHTTAVAPTAATKRPFVATTVGQMEETNDASARLQVKKLSEHAKVTEQAATFFLPSFLHFPLSNPFPYTLDFYFCVVDSSSRLCWCSRI